MVGSYARTQIKCSFDQSTAVHVDWSKLRKLSLDVRDYYLTSVTSGTSRITKRVWVTEDDNIVFSELEQHSEAECARGRDLARRRWTPSATCGKEAGCGFHAVSLPHISRDCVIGLWNVQRRTTHPNLCKGLQLLWKNY